LFIRSDNSFKGIRQEFQTGEEISSCKVAGLLNSILVHLRETCEFTLTSHAGSFNLGKEAPVFLKEGKGSGLRPTGHRSCYCQTREKVLWRCKLQHPAWREV